MQMTACAMIIFIALLAVATTSRKINSRTLKRKIIFENPVNTNLFCNLMPYAAKAQKVTYHVSATNKK
jgi:multisubunit Na+/H+ antiporter MnhF subunit